MLEIAAVSVISKSSQAGLSPSAIAARTSAISRGSESEAPLTLTAIGCERPASSIAFDSTSRSISVISPSRSAVGRKEEGGMTSSLSSSIRTSSSSRATHSLRRSKIGCA